MPRSHSLVLAVAALVVATTVPVVSFAQSPSSQSAPSAYSNSPARLNAQLYQPLDAGQPIHIMLFEDSDQAMALASGLKTSLERAGYLVTEKGAPLSLSFDLSGQGDGAPAGDTSILELESDDLRSIDQRYRAHLDVFSSTQESLMTGQGRAKRAQASTGASIRYQLYLNDQKTGKRVWEGWATSPLLPQGAQATALAMSDPLVAALGQTVRDQGIALRPHP